MAILPRSIQQYFDALAYGFKELIPECRFQNRELLMGVYDALFEEPTLSVFDLRHTRTLITIADQIVIPIFKDAQTLCEAEFFILASDTIVSPKEIRLALKWAYLLLARHGRVEADLTNSSNDLLIWRIVQSFPVLEQGFWVGAIQWMRDRGFSKRSILTIFRESQKFTFWMTDNKLDSFSDIDDAKLHRYILHRALGQSNAAKQKILAGLRAVLYFYKESLDGQFSIPMMTCSVLRDRMCVSAASSKEIRALWNALQSGQLSAMAGLMMLLILGYGLPLRTLPHLKLGQTSGELFYEERVPCRQGTRTRTIRLEGLFPEGLSALWYKAQQSAGSDLYGSYLFTSRHGQRRQRPVSAEYCQRLVQAEVTKILGYPLPVNRLERGALKYLARCHPLTEFMRLTENRPKKKLSRLLYWLSERPSTKF